MHVSNITDDYDNITSSNYTHMLNDYDNMTLSKCTINENNFDLIFPFLLLTTPCGPSFLCLLTMMIYTLIKPLFNKKKDSYNYTSNYT